jgi:hypothetical protein
VLKILIGEKVTHHQKIASGYDSHADNLRYSTTVSNARTNPASWCENTISGIKTGESQKNESTF